MPSTTASAALTDLARGLDSAIALARELTTAQHHDPPADLINVVSELARRTTSVADLVASELPPAHPDQPTDAPQAQSDTGASRASASDDSPHALRQLPVHERDPHTVWADLVANLNDCVPLLESGCDASLRPLALCYEPLLEMLRLEAGQLASLLQRHPN